MAVARKRPPSRKHFLGVAMLENAGYLREKRLTERHKVSIPVKFRLWKSALPEQSGESLDLSEAGICFTTRSIVDEGETIEIRFEMPEFVVDEPTAEWRCTGQVIKVHRFGNHARFDVTVRFDCYEIVRPNGTTTVRLDLNSLRFGSASFDR